MLSDIVRFYEGVDGPTLLVQVHVPEDMWGDRGGALYARPAVSGAGGIMNKCMLQTHQVPAAPRSGADEAWDCPDLAVQFVHLMSAQQRLVVKKRKTGIVYRSWLVDDVERLPNVDQLMAVALTTLDGSVSAPEAPDLAAMMDAALKRALGPIAERLTALESAPKPTRGAASSAGPPKPLSTELVLPQTKNQAGYMYARLTAMAANPAMKMKECLEAGTTETDMPSDWPWAGSQYHEPVAPEYLVQVYSSGKPAITYARQFLTDHMLWECKAAKDSMLNAAMILDHMLLYDGINVMMTASAELCARKMYAVERTYEDCQHKDDWKGKAMHKMMDVYDITRQGGATRVAGADRAARQFLQEEAQTAKWMTKSSKGGGKGSPE